MDGPITSFIGMFVWLKSKLDVEELMTCMALAWGALSYRNSFVHEEQWNNVEVSAASFLNLLLITSVMQTWCIELR